MYACKKPKGIKKLVLVKRKEKLPRLHYFMQYLIRKRTKPISAIFSGTVKSCFATCKRHMRSVSLLTVRGLDVGFARFCVLVLRATIHSASNVRKKMAASERVTSAEQHFLTLKGVASAESLCVPPCVAAASNTGFALSGDQKIPTLKNWRKMEGIHG